MEDDVLDWENDEDEQHSYLTSTANPGRYIPGDQFQAQTQDDAEDAISLDGYDDDTLATETTMTGEDLRKGSGSKTASSPSQYSKSRPPTDSHDESSTPQIYALASPPTHSAKNAKHHVPPPHTHALPPKPTALSLSPVRSGTSATSMRPPSMSFRVFVLHGGSDVVTASREAPLHPDWEMVTPRSDPDARYYYNSKTEQSTWTRPTTDVTDATTTDDVTPASSSRSQADPARERERDSRQMDTYIPTSRGSGAANETVSQSGRERRLEDRSDWSYRPRGATDEDTTSASASSAPSKRRDRDSRHDGPPRSSSRRNARERSPSPPVRSGRGGGNQHRFSFEQHSAGRGGSSPPSPSRFTGSTRDQHAGSHLDSDERSYIPPASEKGSSTRNRRAAANRSPSPPRTDRLERSSSSTTAPQSTLSCTLPSLSTHPILVPWICSFVHADHWALWQPALCRPVGVLLSRG